MEHKLFRKKLKDQLEYNTNPNNPQRIAKDDAIEIINTQLTIIDNHLINEQIEKYDKQREEIIKKYYEDIGKLTDSYYNELIKIL